MSGLSNYDPKAIQERCARLWEERGYFRGQVSADQKPYSIVMPPPNVTGVLHLGHALNNTLQDVLIRFKRMQGFATLWMAGADHAGIATQAVVEKRLKEQENKTRHDVGREELVRRIWEWKDQCETRIVQQLQGIGASCDWRRWRFTLDAQCTKAVRHAFFRLFQHELIFRGKRLVNWDVQLQTAVADDELEDKEIDGHLWQIRYPIEGLDRFVEVATTRPETMLGDTAVAVHPTDPRYQDLIGKEVRLPLVDRLIPIIGDGILVDPKFGTGVVKVTPAHDPNDYACGQRNKLPMINILTPEGRINENGGKYIGLPRYEARKIVVRDLESLGLLAGTTPHRHAVPHSDRSKTAIEPYLSDQWFVRMAPIVDPAMEAVQSGSIRFHPPRYADGYLRWLIERRDWCISRQLWWGHRIPVWRLPAPLPEDAVRKLEAALEPLATAKPDRVAYALVTDDPEKCDLQVCLLDDDPELIQAIEQLGLERDPDVLDTWFSSALWPFSTLGWPDKTPEVDFFYPTSVLSTAREIITLWVARMVVMGRFCVGAIPFRDVYVHAVIMDGDGKKMSKTAGNGVDPSDIIDKYGADALRYTLTHMATETQDVRMPVVKEKQPDGREINTSARFELGRNFGTKIFNAAKLILTNLEGYTPAVTAVENLPDDDRWILHRLNITTRDLTAALETYQFSEAGRLLYDFVWGELCDWYLEMVKPRFRAEGEVRSTAQRVAAAVLDRTLRLLQPVMPFVAEEIWQALGAIAPERGLPVPIAAEASVVIALWPTPHDEWETPAIADRIAVLQEVLRAVRNLRSQFNISPKEEVAVLVECSAVWAEFLQESIDSARQLAKVKAWTCGPQVVRPPKSGAQVLTNCKVFLPLGDLIDLDAETAKQSKKKLELEKRLASVAGKLGNQDFLARAKPEVVEQQQATKAEIEEQLSAVETILVELRS